MKHHPWLMRYVWAGRYRWYCECACGEFLSREYAHVTGAHLAFGKHLLGEDE